MGRKKGPLEPPPPAAISRRAAVGAMGATIGGVVLASVGVAGGLGGIGLGGAALSGCSKPGAAGSSPSAGHPASAPSPNASDPDAQRVVVVELFTSEGCSSCPAADDVLSALVREQPAAGVRIVGIGVHVDYWDDLGWPDPYASRANTQRQRAYAKSRGSSRLFTPEAVVQGGASISGSRRAAIERAIEQAGSSPLAGVRIDAQGDRFVVTAEAPRDQQVELGLVWVEHGLVSRIERGENAGRTLSHAPVARRIDKRPFAPSTSVEKPSLNSADPARVELVVMVQHAETRRVLGAAVAPMMPG